MIDEPNEAVPAPTKPVSKKAWKWTSWILIVFAVIVSIVLIASAVRRHTEEKRLNTSQASSHSEVPPEKMPPQTLRMLEANGNSERVYPPTSAIGYKPAVTGNGFETRCVYPDCHEDSFNPTGPWCESGYTSFYVHDTSGTPGNKVTYIYIKP